MTTEYNLVLQSPDTTVVAEYTPAKNNAGAWQSEADLEQELIRQLQAQGYQYLESIHNETDLIANLRSQLEQLNDYTFSDKEWSRLFNKNLANANLGIDGKTGLLQGDARVALIREDGSTKNITLLDKQNIHNNSLQVLNQYVEKTGNKPARYDVTILVNGFPLVHIELKRRGVAIREAFNQIKRYQNESFWVASGLYEYVQIFVISNGTHTRYYSNTTRYSYINEQTDSGRRLSKKTSNSFEFTSHWADSKNNPIHDLTDFTATFLAKHTLLNILTRFCVFDANKHLLVMRPYQITATERILQRIYIAYNKKQAGTPEARGYIWHTTGSGKTLTSFKTAQLATQFDFVDKVLFVVDRKDLDYQTIKEYERFQKGAANGNKSVNVLTKQMSDPNARIIVTTIQKLNIFISNNPTHSVFKKCVVLIFDECHRSQFGKMHSNIVKTFKNYYLFGFTGTPIFAENSSNTDQRFQTTEQLFGKRLHTYTIVNAINDKNVLPFKVDYIKTFTPAQNEQNTNTTYSEKTFLQPERITKVVEYILQHFEQKTLRNHFYKLKDQRVSGFNSIFAVSSIPMAMAYYQEFKKQLAQAGKDLTVAVIFSAGSNLLDDNLDEESFETKDLLPPYQDFLRQAIADYNSIFHSIFDLKGDSFYIYYQDISLKMKERKIDLLIVVNMFLTGFDATTLNTLWIDKNLRQHSLIQAYSRTNRILNSVKRFGNIVCFRDLQKETDEAVALFSDENASSLVLLKNYADYYNGFDETLPNGLSHHVKGYSELIQELNEKFPLGQPIIGEKNKKDFIRLFGAVLRMRNILTTFDEFEGNEILSPLEMQNYTSIYLDFYNEFKPDPNVEQEDPDLIFELELIRQVEINVDYILRLLEKYRTSYTEDQDILQQIRSVVNSSLELREKKDLIDGFIAKIKQEFLDQHNLHFDIHQEWQKYVQEQRANDVTELINNEHLRPEATKKFLDNALQSQNLRTSGMRFQNILPPLDPFDPESKKTKATIVEKIKKFFDKYLGLVT